MLAERLRVTPKCRHSHEARSVNSSSAAPWAPQSSPTHHLNRVTTPAGLLAIALCCIWLSSATVAQSQHLSPTWQQKSYANSFSRQRTIPRVDHGYLLSFRHRIFDSKESNLFLRSLNTGSEQSLSFWIDGATEIRAEDAAVSSGGQVYVVGSLMRAGQLDLTNFVAAVDRSGNPPRVFDLGSFTPKRVCAANDGTIWAFGLTLGGHGEDGHGDRLLRQYSPDGRLLNAYLPNKKFPALASRGFRREAVSLACGDDSVGVYLARPPRWIEVQSSDSVAYKWRIQSAPPGIVTGVALMNSHELYATFATRTVGTDGKVNVASTLYQLNLPVDGHGLSLLPSASNPLTSGSPLGDLSSGGRPRGSWTPLIDDSDSRAGNVFLLGRDDQSLVYVGRKSEGLDPVLYWVRPQK
jgi:hypothetical protein